MDNLPREMHFGPLWFIPGEKGGRYPFSHSLFLEVGDGGIIVDPASHMERLQELRKNKIHAVWLSHWHEDHFTYLDLFNNVPIFISKDDYPPLTDIDVFLDWYGLEGEYRSYWHTLVMEKFHYRPREMAGFLEGDSVLDLGSLKVKIIHCPGHTPGHLAFYFPALEIAFIGDYDLTPFGPWYGDRFSSIEDTLRSIELLRSLKAKIYITGHETGVFFQPDEEVWERYRNVIFQRETRLMEFLQEPRTIKEIVNACFVYGKPREPKGFFEFGEWAIMSKHLEKLIREEKAVKLPDDRYILLSRC
ncbi:MAG: MBL fold metallo-hydrolase [Syntrophales bacterium]|nr:MBL fold metallo-hydrolase [Syntrophales bacterium]